MAPAKFDQLVHFFSVCSHTANDILGPVLTWDPVMYICVLLILQWHLRFHFGLAAKTWGRPSMKTRRMALNLLILQVYYDPDLHHLVQNRPFVISMILVCVDTFCLFYGLDKLSKYVKSKNWKLDKVNAFVKDNTTLELKEYIDEEALLNPDHARFWVKDPTAYDDNEDGIEDDDVQKATSTYMDVTRSFMKTCGMWVSQSMLVVFYMNHLNGDDDSKNAKKLEYLNWVCAVLLQLYVGDKQLGDPLNKDFWCKIWEKDTKDIHPDLSAVVRQNYALGCLSSIVHKTFGKCFETAGSVPLPLKYFWWLRWFFDMTINGMARNIIMFTFPIMLGAEEPLDFVKDCLAVLFITQLDDLEDDDTKCINEMMVLLKYRLYLDQVLCDHQNTNVHDAYRRLKGTVDYIIQVEDKRKQRMILTKEEMVYICDNEKKFDNLVNFVSYEICVWKRMLGAAVLHAKRSVDQAELCDKLRTQYALEE